MDTPDDIATYKIEKKIKDNRDPFPCDEFVPISKMIPLCETCGHDEDAHEKAKNEEEAEA